MPPPIPEKLPDLPGLGTVLQVMDCRGAHDEAIRLVGSAKEIIYLLGFTFDLPDLRDALISAATRHVPVKVALDSRTTRSSVPRDQQQFAQQLAANHISVTLIQGALLRPEYERYGRKVSGRGIQHAKVVLADDTVIVGSANWTVSSKGNNELGLLVRMSPVGRKLITEVIEAQLQAGERLEVGLSRPVTRRSRSASRLSGTDE